MSTPTIIRTPKDGSRPYFAVSRATAQDKSLSYEARGLLLYLLSKPSDWKVVINDLTISGCGRNKVYRILKELIDKRYIVREAVRNEDGTFIEFVYRVYEEPAPEDAQTAELEGEHPFPQNPEMDNPEMAHPEMDFGDAYIVENKQNRDETEFPAPEPAKSAGSGAGHARPPAPHVALIDAYLDTLGNHGRRPVITNPYARYGRIASAMVKARLTPEQVCAYVEHVYTNPSDRYWQQRPKPIPLEVVAEQLPGWLALQAQQMEQAQTVSDTPDMAAWRAFFVGTGERNDDRADTVAAGSR